MNLRQRVEKLEVRSGAGAPQRDIFVRFVSPDAIEPTSDSSGPCPHRDGVHRITCGEQAWHRLEGETEEALQERAKAEAAQPAVGWVHVFLCYPDVARR